MILKRMVSSEVDLTLPDFRNLRRKEPGFLTILADNKAIERILELTANMTVCEGSTLQLRNAVEPQHLGIKMTQKWL